MMYNDNKYDLFISSELNNKENKIYIDKLKSLHSRSNSKSTGYLKKYNYCNITDVDWFIKYYKKNAINPYIDYSIDSDNIIINGGCYTYDSILIVPTQINCIAKSVNNILIKKEDIEENFSYLLGFNISKKRFNLSVYYNIDDYIVNHNGIKGKYIIDTFESNCKYNNITKHSFQKFKHGEVYKLYKDF